MARAMAGVLIGFSLGLAGCATYARGTTDVYAITTEPPGVIATLSTGETCKTPCKVVLGRRDEPSVTLHLAGYRDRRIEVVTRLSSSGLAHATENLGNAGIGLIVDTATGATLEHVPQQISVVMER